jgi:hypothetical protein
MTGETVVATVLVPDDVEAENSTDEVKPAVAGNPDDKPAAA